MSNKQSPAGMMTSGVPSISPSGSGSSGTGGGQVQDPQPSTSEAGQKTALPNGKKTKGRVKIKMEFIDNKLRRYTTFSKRKTGIMKKVSVPPELLFLDNPQFLDHLVSPARSLLRRDGSNKVLEILKS
jgi:hypothetical protein